MSLSAVAVLIVFPALMAFSAFSDLFTMTIPNRISVILVAAFLVLAHAGGMPPLDIALHIATGLAMLAVTFAFFARGWIGGGDAKLAAATAVWLGWDNLAIYGLEASLLGAGLTLGLLVMRKRVLPPALLRQPWIARLHAAGTGVPYGIALAVAGLTLYPDTAVWQASAILS